jgi:mono/diheme cytochrome c family protein
VEAALTRKKIPYWVLPILIMLPVWGIVYMYTLDKPSPTVAGPIATGTTEFATCAACHGGGGVGGVGPKLAGGNVLKQFPKIQDHLRWVMEGSQGFKDLGILTYGTKHTSVNAGVMPGWSSLDANHLVGVVRYEREVLSGQKLTQPQLDKEYADILAMIKQYFPTRYSEFQAAIAGYKGLPLTS